MTESYILGKWIRSQIEAFYPNIRDLVLYINSTCNLRCRHCYIGNDLLDESSAFATDDLCAFIAEFDTLSRITILGGEPLLHKGINRILRTALQCDIGERRVTTNLTDLFFLDHLLFRGEPITFAVSLDGPDSHIHDSIRGNGAFDKTIRNVRMMLGAGFDVEISHTVNSHNVDHFSRLVALCRTMGIRKLNLHKMSLQGNAVDNAELWLSPHRWVRLCQQLDDMKATASGESSDSLRVRYPPMYASQDEVAIMTQKNEYWPHRQRSYYVNGEGRRIVLYPNGRVYISSELFGTESHLGTVNRGVFTANASGTNEADDIRNPDGPQLLETLMAHPTDEEGLVLLSVSFKRTAFI